MPTLHITSHELTAPERGKIAVRLTRWFVARGGKAARLVVRFATHASPSAFSAGVPIDRAPSAGPTPKFAFVECCVSADRDDDFKAALANETRDLLGGDDCTFFYVRFDVVERANVYFATRGPLVRADRDTFHENTP